MSCDPSDRSPRAQRVNGETDPPHRMSQVLREEPIVLSEDGHSRYKVGRSRSVALAAVSAMLLAMGLVATAVPAAAEHDDHPEKVTICHAAGLEGTTHYETLTIGYPAAYGPAGHFYENGTPRAGHEQDYLGECVEEPELNAASLKVIKLVRSSEQEVPRTRFPFVLSAAGETESFALADGASKKFEFEFDSDRFDVVVGELTGELPDGFSFVSASCAIGERVVDQGSRASVSLLDGAEVTCTFVNRYDSEPEDTPSVTVIKDVRGDSGATTTEFDILVGTRARNAMITLEDGESHEFLPLAGTKDFGIAEQTIEERGWTTAISCESDQREGVFGARGPSLVIDEIGEGEDITCTVINTYDDGGTTPTQPQSNPPSNPPQVQVVETPCFDGTAEDETGACVAPEPPQATVLGIQIESTTTTVEAVATDTLPFTGDDANRVVVGGLLALIAGAALLGASFFEPALVRSGRHEVPRNPIRRWSNT